uniref:Integrase catalytic domain-containing protein n=1 Tax=Strongyloides venezuelensis TaxID=75913 RepID=A0A0K0FW73_STRVS
MIGNVPLRKIYMDILQPRRRTSIGTVAILVGVDSLTRFVMTVSLMNLSSEEVIRTILENIIFKYGIPIQIITDRDSCFSGEEFEKFRKALNIQHHLITANHHQSNGMVERINITFNEAMRIFKNVEWDKTVLSTIFCYDNTIHLKTGFTLLCLIFGRNSNVKLIRRIFWLKVCILLRRRIGKNRFEEFNKNGMTCIKNHGKQKKNFYDFSLI